MQRGRSRPTCDVVPKVEDRWRCTASQARHGRRSIVPSCGFCFDSDVFLLFLLPLLARFLFPFGSRRSEAEVSEMECRRPPTASQARDGHRSAASFCECRFGILLFARLRLDGAEPGSWRLQDTVGFAFARCRLQGPVARIPVGQELSARLHDRRRSRRLLLTRRVAPCETVGALALDGRRAADPALPAPGLRNAPVDLSVATAAVGFSEIAQRLASGGRPCRRGWRQPTMRRTISPCSIREGGGGMY